MSNHTYKLGDRIFLQKDGGPIGLEATGAISRAYMMHYDRLYLEAVERSAHSSGSKRSVHISELVRRILNTSRRLDWSTSVEVGNFGCLAQCIAMKKKSHENFSITLILPLIPGVMKSGESITVDISGMG